MRSRRLAAAAALTALLAGCSQAAGARPAAPPPAAARIVADLRALDAEGTAFTFQTEVHAAGLPSSTGKGAGSFKDTSVALSDQLAGVSRQVRIVEGVLYADRGGSSWLEANADPANFLWPAARVSLLWEAILLSPSNRVSGGDRVFDLATDQTFQLAGALTGSDPPAFLRSSSGLLRVRYAGAKRPQALEVRLHGPAADVDGWLYLGAPATAAIAYPTGASPGNVLTLLFGQGTIA